MANYKRGKCRYKGRTRHNSETFIRKRLGMTPIKIPDRDFSARYGTAEWYVEWNAWHAMIRMAWPPAYNYLGRGPRWHDILHHNRPRRAREKMMAKATVKGVLDPDNTTWPLEHKPHAYYW